MARMRTIKPGFFSNEDLVELPPLARILFAGLWCWADRLGRLEDRPKRIKIEILPGDDCDPEALLAGLAERGLILRYEANGKRYIQVTNFLVHQNPHVREMPSTIPAPPDAVAGTVQAPAEPDTSTGPAPGQHSAEHNLGDAQPGVPWVTYHESLSPEEHASVSNVAHAREDEPGAAAPPPNGVLARAQAFAMVPAGRPKVVPHAALYTALAAALGCDEPATRSEKAKWMPPVCEMLRAPIPVTPEEVPKLVAAFKATNGVPCTPQGIANQLSQLRRPMALVRSNGQTSQRESPLQQARRMALEDRQSG